MRAVSGPPCDSALKKNPNPFLRSSGDTRRVCWYVVDLFRRGPGRVLALASSPWRPIFSQEALMHSPHYPATTSFRIQASEARLISIGLRAILKRHDLYSAGFLRALSRIITVAERRFDRGEFTSDHFVIVSRVIDKTSVLNAASRRIRLDPIEIACCLFGVRTAGMLLRHGHLQAWRPGLPLAIRRLVRKLEIRRKRAKRAYIEVYSPQAFAEESRRWRRFVRWVRFHLLYCPCGRTLASGSRRHRRGIRELLIRDWIELIRTDFPDSGLVASGESVLRDLILRAFRSAARVRRRIGYPTIVRNPDFVRQRVYQFIARRCTSTQPISPVRDEYSN